MLTFLFMRIRRIYIEILESKRLIILKRNEKASHNSDPSTNQSTAKLSEYRKWITGNMIEYLKQLLIIIEKPSIDEDIQLQIAAVRTIIEVIILTFLSPISYLTIHCTLLLPYTQFVKREYLYREDNAASSNIGRVFGLATYRMLIKALLCAESIDVDLLLMIRAEVCILC